MYCTNCGERLSESANFCAYCGNGVRIPTSSPILEQLQVSELAVSLNRIDKIMLVVFLLTLLTTLIPLDNYIIFIGLGLGVTSVALSLYQRSRKAHKVWASVLVFSISSIIINLAWYSFFQGIL